MSNFYFGRAARTALAFAALACSLPSLAHAGSAPSDQADTQSVTVHYGDLDLGHQSGAEAMVHRLQIAAAQSCGPQPDLRDLVGWQEFKTCSQISFGRAVGSLRSPLVTASANLPATVERLASR